MKKALLAAIVLLLGASSARALDHEPEEGLSWQAVLGMNISRIKGTVLMDQNLTGTSDVYKYPCSMDSKVGVALGFRGEFVLPGAHGTYLSFGLEWTQRGGKQKIEMLQLSLVSSEDPDESPSLSNNGGAKYSGTYKINEHYFYIPVHIGYRYNFSDDWGVFAEGGPYFAIGVGGKTRFDADQEGNEPKLYEFKDKTFNKDDTNYHSNGGLQRFDMGLGFRVGVECMNHYSINLDCDWGLTDMLRDDYRDNFHDHFKDVYGRNAEKLKNFCVSVTLGYRF